ncbi:lysoplasmalogenase family protein [Clostridium sp. SHJSY1]|uniref:lysoplasmalogenase family protein n=1 Tax=Clostridium sp. SHJSY1 TaxID=2942483 RepID=UPI0037BE4478
MGHYEVFFKTLCSLCFVFCSYFSFKKSHGNKTYFTLMFLGLIFCLFGDIFLAFSGNEFFLLGVCSFAFAHIFFISGFIYLTAFTFKDFLLYIFLITLSISFILLKDGFVFKDMLTLVLIYASILVFMVTKALSLLKLRKENKIFTFLTITGAILFFISDFILLFLVFYNDCPIIFSYVNLFVYYLGQGLLALSFIKCFKSKKKQRA